MIDFEGQIKSRWLPDQLTLVITTTAAIQSVFTDNVPNFFVVTESLTTNTPSVAHRARSLFVISAETAGVKPVRLLAKYLMNN